MQLYFIRHGQSTNNHLWQTTASSTGRSDDPDLTHVGQKQADSLARYLCCSSVDAGSNASDSQNVTGFRFTHLYTSLMVRAVATGTTVSQALDLPLIAWEELHEGGGVYLSDEDTGERTGQTGKNRAYFETQYPDLILPESLDEVGWWSNRPYEDSEQRSARAQRVLSDMLNRHGGTEDRVAAISHGGFYNDLMAAVLDLPNGANRWFVLNNTAITRLDFHAEGIAVVYLNRADHLPRELVT